MSVGHERESALGRLGDLVQTRSNDRHLGIINRQRWTVTVHAAQGATADEGHALLDGTWTREQADVALTRGRTRTVLHVVADDHDDAHHLLTRDLASSDTARAAALVAVTMQRAHEARVDVTPGIVDRIEAGLRRMSQMVGSWGARSAITTDTGPPAAPTATIDHDGLGL